MADFNTAHETVKVNEGGYNAAYGGAKGSGETYKGIDRKENPRWQGWALIDSYKRKLAPKAIPNEAIIPDPRLEALVADFIKTKYWLPSNAAAITNQPLATFFFDFYFHKPAIAVAAVNQLARTVAPTVKVAKLSLTPEVVGVVNAMPAATYKNLYRLRELHYNNNFLNKEYGIKYVKAKEGVLNRLRRFASTIAVSVAPVAGFGIGTIAATIGFFF
ncbi:MAG: glycosyl hydrolase 108 family protein [Bacteroidota bacterium]